MLSGCTHSRVLDPATTGTLHEINERAKQTPATVTLATGERAAAQHLHLAPDMATWVTDDGGVRSIPLSEVAVVEFESAGRGALDGLKIGLGIGAAAAALAALTTSPCDRGPTDFEGLVEGIFCIGPGGAAAIAGFFIGGAASLVGSIVGGLETSNIIYEVSEAEGAAAEEPAVEAVPVAPSEEARRPLSDEERGRMLRKLRALQEALGAEPGTEALQEEVAAAQARAGEGYLLRQELSPLIDLLQRYGIE